MAPTLSYGAFRALVGLLCRPQITLVGVRHLPRWGPVIAPSNHPHREEIVLGWRIFRRPVRMLLQPGLFEADRLEQEIRHALGERYHFPGWVNRLAPVLARAGAAQAERLGCIPLARAGDVADRGRAAAINRRGIRRAVAALEKGEVIGLAPEGGLTPPEGLAPLQPGVAALAWHFARRDRPVPVVPFWFEGIRGLQRSLLGPGRVVIVVGAALESRPRPGEGAPAYRRRLTGELSERMGALAGRARRIAAEPLPGGRRRYGRIEAPPHR